MKKLIFAVLFVLVSAFLVSAMPAPESYGTNQCELIAKDYQREFGGSLVWIQPLQTNGAYDLGEYSGHLMNKAYNASLGIYYIDYQSGSIFRNISEISMWYPRPSQIFELEKERPPFALWWHY